MDGERPTEQILQQIAEAEGNDPTELSPLFEVIDPEALDQLFATRPNGPERASGSVVFEYEGYEVAVRANGDVSLRKVNRQSVFSSEEQ